MKRLFAWVREPWAINAAQISQYGVSAVGGTLAAVGGAMPQFMAVTISAPLIIAVGAMHTIGGVIGAYAVIRGLWWVERIALRITGWAWFALLPAAGYYAVANGTPSIWLVFILVYWAICDCFKRYRRIDWAYLDPTK